MSKVYTGVRAIFRINNQQIAYATGVNLSVNHPQVAIECLDNLAPLEYAEVGYNVSFSCNTFRVAGESATALGIQPTIDKILTQPELTAELIDRVTGLTLARMLGVKFESKTTTVDARGVSSESWNFSVLRIEDEASN